MNPSTLHVSISKIPLQISNKCIVASIQVDLTDNVLQHFQNELLERIHMLSVPLVIFDLSGVEIMDCYEFHALRKIMSAVTIMGPQTVIAGIKPNVVSSLVDSGADIDDIQGVNNLDAAFSLLNDNTIISDDELADEIRADDELNELNSGILQDKFGVDNEGINKI